jgi:hypothetical protein
MSNRPRVDSWKEIAAYLRRDIRTVIRWEERRGLPVSRLPGGARPRVFAALLLVGRAVWYGLARPGDPPRQLTIVGKELIALDASGAAVWRHPFAATKFGAPNWRWNHIGDLDADGRTEVLATLEVMRPPSNQHHGELASFADDGARLWSVVADDRFAFRDQIYGPPWTPADLSVYRFHGTTRIAWSIHHFSWWPGLLVTLDTAGNRVGTFVNSGWIRGVDLAPSGRELLVSGITNSRDSYFLAVLDAADPTGRSPEPSGSATECLNCPDGHPLQYIAFPRSDVSRHQPFPAAGPTVVTSTDGRVQVHVLSSESPNIADTIFDFDPDLSLREARFSDSFWEWHRRLEAEGRLQHTAAECPERRGLKVQRWTPAAGWDTLPVQVR